MIDRIAHGMDFAIKVLWLAHLLAGPLHLLGAIDLKALFGV